MKLEIYDKTIIRDLTYHKASMLNKWPSPRCSVQHHSWCSWPWLLPPAADTWQGQAGTNLMVGNRRSVFLSAEFLHQKIEIQNPSEKKAASLSISFISVGLTSVIISHNAWAAFVQGSHRTGWAVWQQSHTSSELRCAGDCQQCCSGVTQRKRNHMERCHRLWRAGSPRSERVQACPEEGQRGRGVQPAAGPWPPPLGRVPQLHPHKEPLSLQWPRACSPGGGITLSLVISKGTKGPLVKSYSPFFGSRYKQGLTGGTQLLEKNLGVDSHQKSKVNYSWNPASEDHFWMWTCTYNTHKSRKFFFFCGTVRWRQPWGIRKNNKWKKEYFLWRVIWKTYCKVFCNTWKWPEKMCINSQSHEIEYLVCKDVS